MTGQPFTGWACMAPGCGEGARVPAAAADLDTLAADAVVHHAMTGHHTAPLDGIVRETVPAAVAGTLRAAGFTLASRHEDGWRTLWADKIAVRVELPGAGDAELERAAAALTAGAWLAEIIPAPGNRRVRAWLRVTQPGDEPEGET